LVLRHFGLSSTKDLGEQAAQADQECDMEGKRRHPSPLRTKKESGTLRCNLHAAGDRRRTLQGEGDPRVKKFVYVRVQRDRLPQRAFPATGGISSWKTACSIPRGANPRSICGLEVRGKRREPRDVMTKARGEKKGLVFHFRGKGTAVWVF